MKKCIPLVLCIILLLSVIGQTAFAAEPMDTHRKCSIAVQMRHRGEAVPGGTLSLYYVADVYADSGWHFRYTEEFADCEFPADDASNPETAAALARIVEEKDVHGMTMDIDDRGTAIFQRLRVGLYLLVQHQAAPGYSATSPFLIGVPALDGAQYVYDVDASPKLELEPLPTLPPTEPPKPILPEGDIPQTGQNNWPVPVLAVGGIFLIGLGLICCRWDRKENT